MLRECLVGFRNCDRYSAHAKIDDALRQFPRDGQRDWHSSVIEAGPDTYSGVIRTKNDAVVRAVDAGKWRDVVLPGEGDECESFIEVCPKKPAHFTSFRSPEFACEYVRQRIGDSQAFASFELELISQGTILIRKKSCPYSAPSAWFRVRGKVKSRTALEKLVLQGVGGSHAFGVGLLTPEGSALFPMAKAVAQARA